MTPIASEEHNQKLASYAATAQLDFLIKNLLERYDQSLTALENAGDNPSAKQVLEVLVVRDHVQAALNQKTALPLFAEDITQVSELDERLKKQAKSIGEVASKCHDSLNPPKEAWWWFLESPKKPDSWDRYDYICNGASTVFLTVSITLFTTLIPKFLVGGLDIFQSFGIISGGAVTSLVITSLTQPENTLLHRILRFFKVPPRFTSEVACLLSLLLLGSGALLYSSMPQIAEFYYRQGKESFPKREFNKVEEQLKQAIALDPEKSDAHFWLGRTYEFLEDIENARTAYKQALKGNLPDAYNNLGRLYIEDNKPFIAETHLTKGLQLSKKANDWELTYVLLKNLGWAQLEQKRYSEAEKNLKDAIQLSNKQIPKNRKWDANCVLSEVLAQQGNQKSALLEAKICIKQGYFENAPDYRWYILAKRRIESTKMSQ